MKTLTCILAVTFSIVGYQSFAQSGNNNDPRVQKNISDYNPQRPMVVDSYQPPYFISDKKLATYFKEGTIPASFPKYNYDLSKQDNVDLVRSWLSNTDNFNMLNEEGKAKIEEIKNKKNAK